MACSPVDTAAGVAAVLLCMTAMMTDVSGIGCFLCSSKNGSDPNCEDPFHPGYSTYAESCRVAKKNHYGRFPASFCVKIIGESTTTKETLMIRICVLENMDSQCGLFKFENATLTGCILTCSDDGCNGSTPTRTAQRSRLLYLLFFSLLVTLSPRMRLLLP